MNDHQLDRLVRRAAPDAAAVIAALDLGRGGQELLEEIMSTPVTPQLASPEPAGSEPFGPGSYGPETIELHPDRHPVAGPRRHRRLLVAAAAAAAVAAALVAPAIAFRGSDRVTVVPGSGTVPGPAAPSSAAAASPTSSGPSHNPYLLLDDPAWKVDQVDESGPDEGMTVFTHGTQVLKLTWYPAASYQGHYDDRLLVGSPAAVTVLDRPAALFTYGADDFSVLLPPRESTFVEVRGSAGGRTGFEAEVGRLKQVSAAQWQAALPGSVVTPDRAVDTAAQMLAGVPLPRQFKLSELPGPGTKDEYQYGVVVVGRVTCAWLKIYQSAQGRDDQSRLAEVDAALSTSRQWKVLQRMDKQGDYPEGLWELADQVSARQDVDGYSSTLDCP